MQLTGQYYGHTNCCSVHLSSSLLGYLQLFNLDEIVYSCFLLLFFLKDIKWNGLAEGSPFQRPKAAVILSIDSLPIGKLDVPHSYQYKMLEVFLAQPACSLNILQIFDRMENTVCSISFGYNSSLFISWILFTFLLLFVTFQLIFVFYYIFVAQQIS